MPCLLNLVLRLALQHSLRDCVRKLELDKNKHYLSFQNILKNEVQFTQI